jgi:hypothetical protein
MKSFSEYVESKIKIPKGNLGILRKNMPQIKSNHVPEFMKWLKTFGVSMITKSVAIKTLKMTQKEVSMDKILGMINDAPEESLSKPIILSSDNYILDGHHRFVALYNKNKNIKLTVYQVNVKIDALLELAHKFPKAIKQGINENV